MRITFVHHSCYVVEDDYTQIIFDYTQGTLPPKEDKGRIFVVTHDHGDHFSRRIFSLEGDLYILHSPIPAPADLPVLRLDPFEKITLQDLKIQTSGSTDQGLSIRLTLGGRDVLHAGDLNIWHWPEDSDQERAQMEKDFAQYLAALEGGPLEVLFFPVDGRLGDAYHLGPVAALEALAPRHFFPMHFTEHPEFLEPFAQSVQPLPSQVHILKAGESITL